MANCRQSVRGNAISFEPVTDCARPAPLATDWWDQFLADFYTFEPGPDPPDTS